MNEIVCVKCGKRVEVDAAAPFVSIDGSDAFCSQQCFAQHVLMPLAFEALFGELEEGEA